MDVGLGCSQQSEMRVSLGRSHEALALLGRELQRRDYKFTAVTPTTHRRVFDRQEENNLASVFGWNRWFERNDIDPLIFELLVGSARLETGDRVFRSKVRFASLGDLLFAHSSYPTVETDAVFFGPDTYRFTNALRQGLADWSRNSRPRVLDIGCGSGAGGIFVARSLLPKAEIVLSDVSEEAILFSRVNAELNGLRQAKHVVGDGVDAIDGPADIIICNPPYLIDENRRTYRHGGGALGISLSLRFAKESLELLREGGRLIMYTGTPIIRGIDPLLGDLFPILRGFKGVYTYQELDPDVFGEELERPAYKQADRIAVIQLIVDKTGEVDVNA